MNESKGHFERTSSDEAIRNHEKAWREIREMEDDFAYRQRKRRVLMVVCLIASTAAMIAFIQFGKISHDLAMCFNAVIAAALGRGMK